MRQGSLLFKRFPFEQIFMLVEYQFSPLASIRQVKLLKPAFLSKCAAGLIFGNSRFLGFSFAEKKASLKPEASAMQTTVRQLLQKYHF